MPRPTTSSQSRLPRSPTEQDRFDAVIAWLNNDARTSYSCPVEDVTDYISTDTSVAKSILSKYDPSKIAHLYSDMSKRDSIGFVGELRQEVDQRQKSSLKWRQVLEIAAQNNLGDSESAQAWTLLGIACQQALEVGRELKKRLDWCVAEFESGVANKNAVTEQLLRSSVWAGHGGETDDAEWDDLSEDLIYGADLNADSEVWPSDQELRDQGKGLIASLKEKKALGVDKV